MSSADTKLNVVAYARTSTRQTDAQAGLKAQETSIRSWARARGHRVVAVFFDDGISGTRPLEERPGLGRALLAVEGSADLLVVARLDRLARKLTLQEAIIERLEARGRRVVSVAEPEYEADDGMRVVIRQLVGALAQYERALTSARLQAGRARKAADGGYAYGSPPLGWRSIDGALVRDDSEQATVARMVELRTRGESLRSIAATLTAEQRRPKRGHTWHTESVRRALARIDAEGERERSEQIRHAEAETARIAGALRRGESASFA